MNNPRSKPFDFSKLNEVLRDPKYAAIYLEECYIDGDIELFQGALRNVAKAQKGGVKGVAESAGLNRTSLYRSLSKAGKPNTKTIRKIVDALGFDMHMTFAPKRLTNE